jgi:predicted transcriptional regulator
MSKIKTLEIRAEEGFINELNRLAEASDTTRAEVIDRAIRLYATALEAIEQGKTIQFVTQSHEKNQ